LHWCGGANFWRREGGGYLSCNEVVQLGEKALFRFMVTFAKIYSSLGVDAEF